MRKAEVSAHHAVASFKQSNIWYGQPQNWTLRDKCSILSIPVLSFRVFRIFWVVWFSFENYCPCCASPFEYFAP
jgi:hypothetical protein